MEEIGNPRDMNLYKRSLQFSNKLVLGWTVNNRNEIGEEEVLKVRSMAMEIPKSISKAIVGIYKNNKIKKLNRSKDTFLSLKTKLRNLGMEASEKRLVMMSMELLKLFNGYFGYLGKKKRIINNREG